MVREWVLCRIGSMRAHACAAWRAELCRCTCCRPATIHGGSRRAKQALALPRRRPARSCAGILILSSLPRRGMRLTDSRVNAVRVQVGVSWVVDPVDTEGWRRYRAWASAYQGDEVRSGAHASDALGLMWQESSARSRKRTAPPPLPPSTQVRAAAGLAAGGDARGRDCPATHNPTSRGCTRALVTLTLRGRGDMRVCGVVSCPAPARQGIRQRLVVVPQLWCPSGGSGGLQLLAACAHAGSGTQAARMRGPQPGWALAHAYSMPRLTRIVGPNICGAGQMVYSGTRWAPASAVVHCDRAPHRQAWARR